MTRYLLDTNILSDLVRNPQGKAVKRIAKVGEDVPADAMYGMIRSALEASGTPIGGNDLLIAAHAQAIAATIVTGNKANSNACAV